MAEVPPSSPLPPSSPGTVPSTGHCAEEVRKGWAPAEQAGGRSSRGQSERGDVPAIQGLWCLAGAGQLEEFRGVR